MTQRTPHDGKPYYCGFCGIGYYEYLVCEDGGCELESREDAEDRQAANKALEEFNRSHTRAQ